MAGIGERILTGGHKVPVVLKRSPSLAEITALENGSCKNLSDIERLLGGS